MNYTEPQFPPPPQVKILGVHLILNNAYVLQCFVVNVHELCNSAEWIRMC